MESMDDGTMMALLQQLQQENESLRSAQQMQRQEPTVSLPNKFDGSKDNCRSFINQTKMVFELQPSRFPTQRTKVCFVGTLLTGPAATWFSPIFESNSELLSNVDDFFNELELNFGDFDRETTAANNLRELRQGSKTASEYAAVFRRICTDLSWGEGAFVDQFCRGLNEGVKDLMLTLPIPKTLHEATSAAVRCDERLRERRNDRRALTNRRLVSNENNGPSPMELDALQQTSSNERGSVSLAEKERRRRERLCFYCGEGGHVARDCTRRRGRQGNERARP